MFNSRVLSDLGVRVYGLATVAAGILDFVWGDFEAAHQPIQAWGDHIPGRVALAYITALGMVAAGAAIQWRRTARVGAAASAIIYFIFAVFWLPRFYSAPRVLGFRTAVYLGVLGGVAQQLILVAAAAIIYFSAARLSSMLEVRVVFVARWIFALSSLNFGVNHLAGVPFVAALIPKWMPLGGDFWAIVSGICFLAAGLAILSGVLDVLAARLLALMLLLFSVVVLAPQVLASPHEHTAWGGNAYNLAAVGAAWILADGLASRRAEREQDAKVRPAQAA